MFYVYDLATSVPCLIIEHRIDMLQTAKHTHAPLNSK